MPGYLGMRTDISCSDSNQMDSRGSGWKSSSRSLIGEAGRSLIGEAGAGRSMVGDGAGGVDGADGNVAAGRWMVAGGGDSMVTVVGGRHSRASVSAAGRTD